MREGAQHLSVPKSNTRRGVLNPVMQDALPGNYKKLLKKFVLSSREMQFP